MSQTLKHGSEVATSARNSVSQRAPLKTVLGLLGASAIAGCGSESVVNNYYQGPDGHYVSLRQEVPSTCTLVTSGTLNQGENLTASVNGRSYRIQLDDLESPRSRDGLPPSVLLPAALYSVTDTMGAVLAHANVREGGVQSTRVTGLTIQAVTISQGYTFGSKWADTNVYQCQ